MLWDFYFVYTIFSFFHLLPNLTKPFTFLLLSFFVEYFSCFREVEEFETVFPPFEALASSSIVACSAAFFAGKIVLNINYFILNYTLYYTIITVRLNINYFILYFTVITVRLNINYFILYFTVITVRLNINPC